MMIGLAVTAGIALLTGLGFGQSTTTLPSPQEWKPILASDLIGRQLWGIAFNELGQISSLGIDESNGRVPIVILSDVPGFGAHKVAVPFPSVVKQPGWGYTINFPEGKNLDFFYSQRTRGPLGAPRHYQDAMAKGEIRGPIDPSFVSSLYADYGVPPYWTEKGERPLESLYTTDHLLGKTLILGQRGKASIQDLVVDSSDGHIALLVISDLPGRPDAQIAVPYSAVSLGEKDFALNLPEEKLASAPVLNLSELQSGNYLSNVYRYYGAQPYWTEK